MMRRQSNFSFPSFPKFKAVSNGEAKGLASSNSEVGSSQIRGRRSRFRKYSVQLGRSMNDYIKEFASKKGLTDKWYLLDPRKWYVITWDVYMVVLLLFTTIVTPFEVCFLSPSIIPFWLTVLNYVVDCSFFLDLCLNFCRMSFDENTGIPIADPKVIRATYLKGYFFVDFISCLPFDQLAILFGAGDKAEALKVLRLLKLVRLAKLVKMINSQELMQKLQDFFEFRHGTRRLLRFVFLSMFISHFMACGWHVVARMEDPDDAFTDLGRREDIHDNWISYYFDLREPYATEPRTSTKYIVALYLSVMTVTTVGYGDVQPRTTGERVYLIFAMLFGASMQAYVVGSICGIISNLNQRSGEYNQVMDALNAFISENKIETELARRLRSFMRYTKKNTNNFRKWQTVLQLMSPKLQEEAALSVNIDWMKEIDILKNAPKEMIVRIAFSLKSVSFSPCETIVKQAKKIDRLYIVRRGLVFKGGRIQGTNTIIGEEMLHSKYSLHSVSSMTFVDTNTIDYTDFQMILDKYPQIRNKLKKRVVQNICRQNVIRFTKAVTVIREASKKIIEDCDSEAEAWAKILSHECLAEFSHAGRMTIVRKSLQGTIHLDRLIKIVCLIQRAFKRYKKRKQEQIDKASEKLVLYNLQEQLNRSDQLRSRQFQELKERMHRLSEQQYKLFAELLYQHKFAKGT